MKKKIVLSFICGVLLIGLMTGCGNDTNTNSNNSTTNNNNEATQNNESARYDKTFDFYGYTVAYASDCTMSVRTGGYTVTRNSDFWIVYSTPSLFGEEFTVEELKKAYARDEHFNDMPRCGGTLYPFRPNLGTWDTLGRRLVCPWEKFGEFETLAARVCVLKCAAAMIATE